MKITEQDIEKQFNSFTSFTEEDAQKVMDNQEKIEKIAKNETLRDYLDSIKLFFMMLKDIFSGNYKKVPMGTIAAIVGALLYVLAPLDLIPDMIPGVGYLDDAGILAFCLQFTKKDIDQYKQWKEQLSA